MPRSTQKSKEGYLPQRLLADKRSVHPASKFFAPGLKVISGYLKNEYGRNSRLDWVWALFSFMVNFQGSNKILLCDRLIRRTRFGSTHNPSWKTRIERGFKRLPFLPFDLSVDGEPFSWQTVRRCECDARCVYHRLDIAHGDHFEITVPASYLGELHNVLFQKEISPEVPGAASAVYSYMPLPSSVFFKEKSSAMKSVIVYPAWPKLYGAAAGLSREDVNLFYAITLRQTKKEINAKRSRKRLKPVIVTSLPDTPPDSSWYLCDKGLPNSRQTPLLGSWFETAAVKSMRRKVITKHKFKTFFRSVEKLSNLFGFRYFLTDTRTNKVKTVAELVEGCSNYSWRMAVQTDVALQFYLPIRFKAIVNKKLLALAFPSSKKEAKQNKKLDAAHRIKMTIVKRNIRMKDLAKMSGVSAVTLSKLNKNVPLSDKVINKLLQALNLPPLTES